ncbi:MAG TPA: hypothetical protein VIM92_14490, partial [Rhodanobacteraceae bacterium]
VPTGVTDILVWIPRAGRARGVQGGRMTGCTRATKQVLVARERTSAFCAGSSARNANAANYAA